MNVEFKSGAIMKRNLDKMQDALRRENVKLKDLFMRKVDIDGDGHITNKELMNMFGKMQLDLTQD